MPKIFFMKRIVLFSTLSLGLFFVACKKDKKDETKEKSKKELLKAGKWQAIEDIVYGTQNGQEFHENNFDDAEPCEIDDFVTFDDTHMHMDQGPEKCDPSEPQVETRSYWLIDDEKRIVVDYGSGNDTVDVVELTESTLKVHSHWQSEGQDLHNEVTFTNLNK